MRVFALSPLVLQRCLDDLDILPRIPGVREKRQCHHRDEDERPHAGREQVQRGHGEDVEFATAESHGESVLLDRKVRVEVYAPSGNVCIDRDQSRMSTQQLRPVRIRPAAATEIFGRQLAAVYPGPGVFLGNAAERNHAFRAKR